MQTKRPDGLNHPDAHPPSAPAGGGPEGAEAPAETRNHIQSAPEGSSAAGGAAKSRPQDCNRIRRLRRRGGSFPAEGGKLSLQIRRPGAQRPGGFAAARRPRSPVPNSKKWPAGHFFERARSAVSIGCVPGGPDIAGGGSPAPQGRIGRPKRATPADNDDDSS